MSARQIIVAPDTNIKDCADLMKKERIGALIVKDGLQMVGIFTERDMVRRAMTQEKPPSEITAREVMTTDIVSVEPGSDIAEAIRLIKDYNVRHLPVINNGELVGVVTSKDILKLQPALFDIFAERLEQSESAHEPR